MAPEKFEKSMQLFSDRGSTRTWYQVIMNSIRRIRFLSLFNLRPKSEMIFIQYGD